MLTLTETEHSDWYGAAWAYGEYSTHLAKFNHDSIRFFAGPILVLSIVREQIWWVV